MENSNYYFTFISLLTIPLIASIILILIKKSEKTVFGASIFFLLLQLGAVLNLSHLHQKLYGSGFSAPIQFPWLNSWGISLIFSIDSMSIPFLITSAILAPILYVVLIPIEKNVNSYTRSTFFFLLLFGMYGAFCALDMVIFYIMWELVLLPVFVLVGLGKGPFRQNALMKFLLYSLGSSLVMLLGIASLSIFYKMQSGLVSFNFFELKNITLPIYTENIFSSPQWWVCSAFILAFLVKAHAFPLHAWLPDLYKEGTPLSTSLVSVLLFNMATYAMLRFLPVYFPNALVWWGPVLMTLGAVGIIYGALCVMSQSDLRQVLAYMSVSHVGFFLLGFGALTSSSLQASLIQTINHAYISAGMALVIFIFAAHKNDFYIGSITNSPKSAPWLTFFFFLFLLSTMGLPGTNGFVGEFLVLASSFQKSFVITTVATLGVILSATYGLALFQKVFFPASASLNSNVIDLKIGQKLSLGFIAFMIIYLGLFPNNYFHMALIPIKKLIYSH